MPEYTVADQEESEATGSVALVIPNATEDEAIAAIRDFAEGIDGQLHYEITVVRNQSDGDYVCRGKWVKDEKAAEIYGSGQVVSDSWPAIDTDCPGS
ncbi:hypothetical protein [Streptomyces aidingensis]|uniref:hypothetical protein n=1 Tax=Streptomyces aidingensis TaxID=910347 RepID=UPI000B86947D|nr:hypothetical protein [Streptomyces aidingensis]